MGFIGHDSNAQEIMGNEHFSIYRYFSNRLLSLALVNCALCLFVMLHVIAMCLNHVNRISTGTMGEREPSSRFESIFSLYKSNRYYTCWLYCHCYERYEYNGVIEISIANFPSLPFHHNEFIDSCGHSHSFVDNAIISMLTMTSHPTLITCHSL
jgi:hypothetical protein